MVKLGFIKDAGQCPLTFPRIYVRAAERPLAGTIATTVYSKPVRGGGQSFELAVEVTPGAEHVELWTKELANVVTQMGWTTWWLDSFSLSQVMDRYITEALRLWGMGFWAHYETDSTVLVLVGLQREAVALAVAAWQDKFKYLELSPEHDFEALEKELAQQSGQRMQKLKSLLTPKFLETKQRST